ncbi:hypothetical protein ABK905_15405 [Acerihabitans sp. KWT182]|uniref:Uncharacterized protein n=1 Tax=Acerihabitans sp. KWT182 TaxID=3157919 RepID=A0AAU7Q4W5_9GAMM
MISIKTPTSPLAPATNATISSFVQTKSTKNVLPLVSVNNENRSPNINRRSSHSELSGVVMEEVQRAKQHFLRRAIREFENGGSYRAIADKYPFVDENALKIISACREAYNGGNCRRVAEKYSLNDEASLKRIHYYSLITSAAGSAGTALLKGENCDVVAKAHGIEDPPGLSMMQAFAACRHGKQIIMNGHSANEASQKYGITDEKVMNELKDFEKKHHATPQNYLSKSLDAAVLHNEKMKRNGVSPYNFNNVLLPDYNDPTSPLPGT